MAWRGFLIESYIFIYPRTIKDWVKFIYCLSRAWWKFYKLEQGGPKPNG